VVEEGDIYRVKYGEGDTWKCPVCGQEVFTPNYDTEEMLSCPECGSGFDAYIVQEVTGVGNEKGRSESESLTVQDRGDEDG